MVVSENATVYFQAIDGNGHVVQTMRSWSTLMPGETFSCVGCHAYDSSAASAKANTLALQKGVAKLQPFYDVSGRGFSFPKTIQPIVAETSIETVPWSMRAVASAVQG